MVIPGFVLATGRRGPSRCSALCGPVSISKRRVLKPCRAYGSLPVATLQAEEKFSKGEVLPPSDASRCSALVCAFVVLAGVATAPTVSPPSPKLGALNVTFCAAGKAALLVCRRPEPLPPAGPAAAPIPRLERTLLGGLGSGMFKKHLCLAGPGLQVTLSQCFSVGVGRSRLVTGRDL